MKTFEQFITEIGPPAFSKGEGPVPEHTTNPFHAMLTKHGFKHEKSTEGAYRGSEWHHYSHPEKGTAQATVYPKNHGFGETHWNHTPAKKDNFDRPTSAAGKTNKSLDAHLTSPEEKTRGVHYHKY